MTSQSTRAKARGTTQTATIPKLIARASFLLSTSGMLPGRGRRANSPSVWI